MPQLDHPHRKTVRASQLPAELVQDLGVAPDTELDITIELASRRGERLRRIMDEIGAEARRNGMTEADLEAILRG